MKNQNRLVLVSTAGSAAAGSLELPALGANIRPGEENKHLIQNHRNITNKLDLFSKSVSHYSRHYSPSRFYQYKKLLYIMSPNHYTSERDLII